ncbi:MAG: hypothetical protein NTZ52_02845 [Chlamydiae bacterium]|nr:hypothetical protein [Chlamydiota bacterium]
MNIVNGRENQPALSSTPGAGVGVVSGVSAVGRLMLESTVITQIVGMSTAANGPEGFASACHSYEKWDRAAQISDLEGQQLAIGDGLSATTQMVGGFAFAVNRISSVVSFVFGLGEAVADKAEMVGMGSFTAMYSLMALRYMYTFYHTRHFQTELLGPHKTTADKIAALQERYLNPDLDNHQELEAVLSRYIGEDGVRQLKELSVLIRSDHTPEGVGFLHREFEDVFRAIEQKLGRDQVLSLALIASCVAGLVMGLLGDAIHIGSVPVLSLVCFGLMLMTDCMACQAGLDSISQIGSWDKIRIGIHASLGVLSTAGLITVLATSGVATFGVAPAVIMLAICVHWIAFDYFMYRRVDQKEKAYDLTNFYWCGVFNDVSTLFTAPIDQLTTEQVSDLLDAVQDLYKQQPSILLYKMKKKLLQAPRTPTSLAEYCRSGNTPPARLQAAYDRRAAIRRLTYNELQHPSPTSFLRRAARSRITVPLRAGISAFAHGYGQVGARISAFANRFTLFTGLIGGGLFSLSRALLPQIRRSFVPLTGFIMRLPRDILGYVRLATTVPPQARIQWEVRRLLGQESFTQGQQIGLLDGVVRIPPFLGQFTLTQRGIGGFNRPISTGYSRLPGWVGPLP